MGKKFRPGTTPNNPSAGETPGKQSVRKLERGSRLCVKSETQKKNGARSWRTFKKGRLFPRKRARKSTVMTRRAKQNLGDRLTPMSALAFKGRYPGIRESISGPKKRTNRNHEGSDLYISMQNQGRPDRGVLIGRAEKRGQARASSLLARIKER